MSELLDRAAEVPSLRDHVMSGVGAESLFGGVVSFNSDKMRVESKEVFYSLLGSRLASLPRMQTDTAREVCSTLLNQCFRYGPNGADTGVFVLALSLREITGINKEAGSAYLQRLENQRALRMSLLPLALEVSKGIVAPATKRVTE
jgi:hypothetical protein